MRVGGHIGPGPGGQRQLGGFHLLHGDYGADIPGVARRQLDDRGPQRMARIAIDAAVADPLPKPVSLLLPVGEIMHRALAIHLCGSCRQAEVFGARDAGEGRP